MESASRDEVEGGIPKDNVTAVHDLKSCSKSQEKEYSGRGEFEDEETLYEPFLDLEPDYLEDEHALCSVLLYYISKTLLGHLTEDPPMDRFAEQIFGRPDRDQSRSRPPERSSSFVEMLAKTLAKSAAKRAMGDSTARGRAGFGEIGPEDFRGLGGFVLEMLGGKGDERRGGGRRERGRREEEDGSKRDGDKRDRKRRRKRSRGRQERRSRDDTSRQEERPPHDPERRKRRRRHHSSPQPPLRVSFAEPYHHRHSPPRKHRGIDLAALQSELEAMSSTIIKLNARGARHRDCEFYDRFVRKGGRLQDVIGSTLGRIREVREGR